jgi:hypothetical protein
MSQESRRSRLENLLQISPIGSGADRERPDDRERGAQGDRTAVIGRRVCGWLCLWSACNDLFERWHARSDSSICRFD